MDVEATLRVSALASIALPHHKREALILVVVVCRVIKLVLAGPAQTDAGRGGREIVNVGAVRLPELATGIRSIEIDGGKTHQ
jgi:hypothetical protein